jgi:hypothetical protein
LSLRSALVPGDGRDPGSMDPEMNRAVVEAAHLYHMQAGTPLPLCSCISQPAM